MIDLKYLVVIICLLITGCDNNFAKENKKIIYPKAKITRIAEAYIHPRKLGKTIAYYATDIKTKQDLVIVNGDKKPVFKVGDVVNYGGTFHSLDDENNSAPIRTSCGWY